MIGRYTVSDLHNDITRVGHHVTENDSDISKASSRFRPEGRNRGLPIGWIRLNNRKQEAASIKATSMDNNATQGKGDLTGIVLRSAAEYVTTQRELYSTPDERQVASPLFTPCTWMSFGHNEVVGGSC